MTKVLVNGAKGKMGSMASSSVQADPDLVLVGQTDVGDDLVASIQKSGAEVVVDFTIAATGYDNFLKIIEAGAYPVVGTSGFSQEKVARLADVCRTKGRGALIAPNFSIGAVLMMKFAQEAAALMPHVEIIEGHHERKLDAPSGTAVRTAELIRDRLPAEFVPIATGEEMVAGARGGRVGGVPVHAVRLPGLLAQQRVIFGATGETLVIEHTSIDRQCFMAGVCLAAKKIVGKKELFYGLETLLWS